MSTLSTVTVSNSSASVYMTNHWTGNSVSAGDWYIDLVPVEQSSSGTTFINPFVSTPQPYAAPYTQITVTDPRVEELEKKLAALEELVTKLLPKALKLQEPPETDGKRVVEL